MLITEEEKSVEKIVYFIECIVILHKALIVESEMEVPPQWLSEADISHINNNDRLNCSVSQDFPRNTRQMHLITYINELVL